MVHITDPEKPGIMAAEKLMEATPDFGIQQFLTGLCQNLLIQCLQIPLIRDKINGDTVCSLLHDEESRYLSQILREQLKSLRMIRSGNVARM